MFYLGVIGEHPIDSLTLKDTVTSVIIATCSSLFCGFIVAVVLPHDERDVFPAICKYVAWRFNIVYCGIHCAVGAISGAYFCICFVWRHRSNIRRAINVFVASILLYFIENAGLAIMTNVLLALVAGYFYGYVVCGVVGFISAATSALVYNKGQVRLRMIVAERKL